MSSATRMVFNKSKTKKPKNRKMKKLLTILFVVLAANLGFGQNMVKIFPKIYPKTDTLCYGETIYMNIPGNSFQPTSYLWSNGSTASTIQANGSGVYMLTVTGYLGNSSKLVTLTLMQEYDVLPKPSINPETATWVCKLDTVRLSADPGYASYQWSNGTSGQSFEKVFNVLGGGQVLDTVSVWYTGFRTSRNYSCSVNSDTIVIRGIRRPDALTPRYCGATNLSLLDSVKTDLVLTYIWDPAYEVEFTDVSNPSNVITHTTAPGNRRVPLNMLQVGSTYDVRTRPVINGTAFCWGSTCQITVTSSSKFGDLSLDDLSKSKTFRVFDMSGRFVFERQDVKFNQEWFLGMPEQIYAVMTLVDKEIIKRELISSRVLR